MSKKKKIIMLTIIIFLIIIIGLWVSGLIPKQIAKISGNAYMNKHFPEMQLKFVDMEWSKYHDDYIATFKDKDNKTYSCTIGPKYFPIDLGQGLFAIEEIYRKEYVEKDNLQETAEYEFVAEIIEVDKNHIMVKPDANSREIKSGDKISVGITRPTNETNDCYVVGNKIKITYDGTIMASYPPQIYAIKTELVNEIQDISTENKWDANKVSIKIKEDTLTNEGAKIIITDKNDKPISWGVEFSVEVFDGKKWRELIQNAEYTWIAIALLPDENGVTQIDCNWSSLYGKLENGTYRIVKNTYDKVYQKIYSEPFKIE